MCYMMVSDSNRFHLDMGTESRIQHQIRLDMNRILVSDSVPFRNILEYRIQHRIHLDMGRIPDSVSNP